MSHRLRNWLIWLTVVFIVIALRLACVLYQRSGPTKVRPISQGLLDKDSQVVIPRFYADDLGSARKLVGKTLWVKAGYRATYFPWRAQEKAKPSQAKLFFEPMESLVVEEVTNRPIANGSQDREVLFLFRKGEQIFATIVGFYLGKEQLYQVRIDELFFPMNLAANLEGIQERSGFGLWMGRSNTLMVAQTSLEELRSYVRGFLSERDSGWVAYRDRKGFPSPQDSWTKDYRFAGRPQEGETMTTAGSCRQACLAFGKIGFAGFLFFSPQSPGIGPAQSESQAMEVIRKMSETYRTLGSYEFEGVLKLESKAEGFQKTREIPFLKAAVLPGKLRIERGGPKNRTMLVSDGENSWLYFPPHYSKTAPGDMKRFLEQGPAEEPGTLSALHNTFVNQYAMMTETAKRARILGEESLDLSGELKTCYVVGLDDGEAPDSAAEGVFPRTLWIEKDRLIVLKEISTSRTESPKYRSTLEIRQTLTLHLAKINESLPEDLFVFTPPSDVREIFLPGLGPPSRRSLEGELAKEFALKDLNGEPVDLKNLRGKVVLLNFWATWCGPCRIEMPFLDQLQKEFKQKGLVVLGITDEEPELAEAFLARHHISFSNLSDRQQEVATFYQVRAIPTVFVINREGKIVYQGIGVSREDVVRRALKEAGIEAQ